MDAITIIEPKKPEEFHVIEEIQKKAWGMQDIEVVPYRIIIAMKHAGGSVYIAKYFDKSVGFVVGFIGINKGKLFLHSHQLGVVPEFWGKNIGYFLKLKQREHAIKLNLDLIKWTFDPLLSRNAYLNFNKLGVTCKEFHTNFYGIMQDAINKGLPSDRFYVDWWIRSKRVANRLNGEKPPQIEKLLSDNLPIINKTKQRNNYRIIDDLNLNLKDKVILVEIPGDLNVIKNKSMNDAMDWRMKTRAIFQKLINEDHYIVIDFVSGLVNGERRSFYILGNQSEKEILSGNWWEK